MKDEPGKINEAESLDDVSRQFEAIFSNLPVGLTYLTPDMRFIRINPFLEKKLGLKSDDIKGRHCYDTSGQYHNDPTRKGEERICDVCGVKEALKTGEPYKFTRRVSPDFIIENLGVPIKDNTGNIIGAIEIIVDITDRARMQERLEALVQEKSKELYKSQSLLNNIINSSADAIFTLDVEGRFRFLNPAAEGIFGQPEIFLVGKGLCEVISPADMGRIQEAMRQLREKSLPLRSFRLMLPAAGGEERWLLMSISPLSGEDETNRYVGVCKDITNEKKLEGEKEEFITMVTHDLKTPLTSIIGYSSMLLEEKPGEGGDARACMEGIKVNADRMLNLVKNFLSAGRMDEQMFRIDPRPVKIEPVIMSSIKAMEHQLREKDIAVEADFPPNLPDIKADRDYMERVLCNLISNAIKFTPVNGKIGIRAFPSADGYVHIEVSDTGVGIPENELPLLFDKYYQGTNKLRGSGLGLFIAKSIVEAHDGEIQVESQRGQGTVFTIRLPHA